MVSRSSWVPSLKCQTLTFARANKKAKRIYLTAASFSVASLSYLCKELAKMVVVSGDRNLRNYEGEAGRALPSSKATGDQSGSIADHFLRTIHSVFPLFLVRERGGGRRGPNFADWGGREGGGGGGGENLDTIRAEFHSRAIDFIHSRPIQLV